MTWLLLDFCQYLKAVSCLLLRIETEIQQNFQTQKLIIAFLSAKTSLWFKAIRARWNMTQINSSSCISPRISDQSSALHSNSLHTDNKVKLKQLNSMEILIYFIFSMIKFWVVNMTGKTKGWPINSPISPDIVRWSAVEVFLTNSHLSWCSRHNLLWTSCATLLNNKYIILGSGLV